MSNIMIIDDETMVLKLLTAMLVRKDHTPLCFSNPKEALEDYKKNSKDIDLIIVDYNMPGMSGIDLLNEMAQISPVVKALISSGDIDNEELTRLSDNISYEILSKPYTMDTLTDRVRDMIEKGL